MYEGCEAVGDEAKLALKAISRGCVAGRTHEVEVSFSRREYTQS